MSTVSVYLNGVCCVQRLVQPNPLQTVQAGDVQRFYFDTRGGKLHVAN